MTERIGFIGVGLMGHGMAKNLVEKGYPLTVLGHRNRAPVDDLVKCGAKEAKTAEEVAKNSDIVFLCVTGSTEVEALVRGVNSLKSGAHKNLIIVDCSTSDPNSTIVLATELKPLGVAYCDAPLGGTPQQAEEGKLSAMVGSDAEVWPRIEKAIGAWAAKAVRVGDTGDGHKLKLLMNFLSMGYGALYAELLAVARKNGLTPQAVHAVMRGSRFDCGMYQTFFAWVLNREEAHKFTIKNSHKDMKYLAAMAEAGSVANPMGNAVKNYYALAEAAGRGDLYVPTLADFVAELNGISPSGAKRHAAE
ncbi:MAG: NAD(P)-dependent oxidoreductase [Rhizobiales bacterium]|nr:NAD(P)-dependent oxidoreductase [Hyphomicrobiales bacterium]